MLKNCLRCWGLGVALSMGAACQGHTLPSSSSDDTLRVGFASVDIAWRAGAKPGQVGTPALPERDDMFARGVAEVLPILRKQPTDLLRDVTDWALKMLEKHRTTIAGKYSTYFEPGRGIELPPAVRVLVVERGGVKVAIVRADLYIMSEHLHTRVAELIKAKTGIGAEGLFLAAAHNHSTPHGVSPGPGVWTRADAFDPRHFVYISHKIAEAIIAANRDRQAAVLRVYRDNFGEVQRNIIGPGQIAMSPPEGGPEQSIAVGYPREHFDRDLLLLRFDRASDLHPIAAAFIFGMHPESLPEGHAITSGEWPRHAEDKFERQTGVPAVWLPGALGDVEPDDGQVNPAHRFWRKGFAPMITMATIIAEAFAKAYAASSTLPVDAAPIVWNRSQQVPGPPDHFIPDLAEVGPRLPTVRIVQDDTTMRLHVVRLGPALLLGAPAEITTDLDLAIKSRVDDVEGNAYQGYIWSLAPTWVRDAVGRNFTADELPADLGVRYPMVLSIVNGYFGYVVTRWEYENRNHYRQSMTFFGPGTADHIARAFVALVRKAQGGPSFTPAQPDWAAIDRAQAERVHDWLAALERDVAVFMRDLPPSDAQRVGVVLSPPTREADGTLRFRWVGGTNDMEVPQVVWVKNGDENIVAPTATGRIFFSPPDEWTAELRPGPQQPVTGAVLRVRGWYRGTQKSRAVADPLWDPEGKNRPYEFDVGVP